MHKSYYLHKRKDRGGVYYVRYVFDKPFGGVEVLPWVSSGETEERAAYDWAAKNGPKLQPKKRDLGAITPFGEWAKGWWEPGHDYVIRQSARGYSLTPNYLDQCRSLLKHHIIPHFGKAKIGNITPKQADDWVFLLKQQGLSPTTCNHALYCFKEIVGSRNYGRCFPETLAASFLGCSELSSLR